MDNQDNINKLKAVLPSIDTLTELRNISGELHGACPNISCGSDDDAFWYKPNEQKGYCRQCTPKGDDVIGWHCKKYNTTIQDLFIQHGISGTNTPTKDVNALWSKLQTDDKILDYLVNKRKLNQDIVKQAINDNIFRYSSPKYYGNRDCLVVAYRALNDLARKENVYSIQYVSMEGNFIFHGIESKINKSFKKGIDHKDGFVQFGKSIESADSVIITEGVVDALSGAMILPEYCWIVVGSATYTKKLEQFKNSNIKRVIVFQDNDEAGNTLLNNCYKVLKSIGIEVFNVEWAKDDPKDVNDLIKIGKPDQIKEMVAGAKLFDKPIELELEPIQTEKPKDNKENKPIIEVYSFDEIYNENPQQEWIIKDFLPKNENNMITATGGIGKSMFSIYLASVLAKEFNSDFSFHNLFNEFSIEQSNLNSLFIQSENSKAQFNSRIRAMGIESNIRKNLFSPKINNQTLSIGKPFLDNINGVISSKNFEEWLYGLINFIQDNYKKKIDIIWIDPLITFCNCSENDNAEMRKNLDVVTQIAQIFEITPVIIHHNAKDNHNKTYYRGASSIYDWTRNLITFNQDFIKETQIIDNQTIEKKIPVIEVTHEKSNIGRKFSPFKIKMNNDCTFSRVIETSIKLEETQEIKKVIQALKDLGGKAKTQKELIDKYSELTDLTSQTSLKKYIKQSIECGLIIKEKNPNEKGDIYKINSK